MIVSKQKKVRQLFLTSNGVVIYRIDRITFQILADTSLHKFRVFVCLLRIPVPTYVACFAAFYLGLRSVSCGLEDLRMTEQTPVSSYLLHLISEGVYTAKCQSCNHQVLKGAFNALGYSVS